MCTVQPESGPAVTIPVTDIVSGKPVPPRASVRQRVSAREAERHASSMWPSVERVALGEWELRTDPAPVDRLRKRANSCLALGDPGLPLPGRGRGVRDFYAARGREALAQVELGSDCRSRPSRRWGGRRCPAGTRTSCSPRWRTPRGWRVRNSTSRWRRTARGFASYAGWPGAAVGSGQAALDGDWLGIHGLEVEAGTAARDTRPR